MNIVIFDDEKQFCMQLNDIIEEFFIKTYPNVNFAINIFTNEMELEHFISGNVPQIIFLDIATPNDENYGLNIAKYIRKLYEKVHIIFVTSCKDKIIDALDELVRPSQFFYKPASESKVFKLLGSIIDMSINSNDYITLKYGRSDCLINTNEIYYIKKIERKTKISSVNKSIEVRDSLASVCLLLPENFLCIDKGTVINVKMIESIDYLNGYVTLKNGFKTDLARRSKKLLKSSFERYKEESDLCNT